MSDLVLSEWEAASRVLGIGIDTCEIERLRLAIRRQKHRLRNRLFTSSEQARAADCGRQDIVYATGYAVKEAASKALGTGINGRIGWHDIEYYGTKPGPGHVILTGSAHRRARWLARPHREYRIHLDISVALETVSATVVLEGLGS